MKCIKVFLVEKKFYTSQNDLKLVDPELVRYITNTIYPMYDKFDVGHNHRHLFDVIKYSLYLAKELKVDSNMCYTIAAYHDAGLSVNREHHHTESGKIISKDKKLKKWFDEREIMTMIDAVEDHRASSKRPPRTIYGKIVADADRSNIKLEWLMERSIAFHLDRNKSKSDLFDEVYSIISRKYGEGGYAKFILPQTKKMIAKDMRRNHTIIADIKQFKKIYQTVAKKVFNLGPGEIFKYEKKK